MSAIPSPEFSDSLDSTIACNQCLDNEANYNGHEHHIFERQLIIDDHHPEKRPIRRTAHAENLGSRGNPKNVLIDPSPRYLGSNQCVYNFRDSVPDNLMTAMESSEERKATDVRRVASSDSIPRTGNNHGLILNQGCRVLSQDCVRRVKNSDARNMIAPLRYIQSAKGTWTYNL